LPDAHADVSREVVQPVAPTIASCGSESGSQMVPSRWTRLDRVARPRPDACFDPGKQTSAQESPTLVRGARSETLPRGAADARIRLVASVSHIARQTTALDDRCRSYVKQGMGIGSVAGGRRGASDRLL
jgi:hypothetical protein